ncbi:hypothetical protein [Geomesophilobacter sediminis]|uniref:Uncharacterized protein n=1 Tax=Geomesophilobacter sediminis TaxID=2798584 RepID=A0A8J7JLY7_9BACT|nr:hypothetical protein [Geomesophilobacter sediminis]MBJ6725490.1 hypothetical protein [Geomesophilobacter sediminis]
MGIGMRHCLALRGGDLRIVSAKRPEKLREIVSESKGGRGREGEGGTESVWVPKVDLGNQKKKVEVM